ncbi:MAG: hypothetical protein WCO78_04815 [Candidatus Roizmanbacteria bacterium]
MRSLYKQPLIEAAILASGIVCTILVIHGVQTWIALSGQSSTSQIAQTSPSTNTGLVQVSAGSFALGDTCNTPGVCSANNYSSSDPPIINPASVPEAYDLDRYAIKDAVAGASLNISTAGYDASELDGAGPNMYPKLCTMFGNTFPLAFTAVEKHRSNAGDNNTPSADGGSVFQFDLPAGTPITIPVSGRNIAHGLDSAGNGPEGMIMYAAADRFAFQIGRKDFLKNIWIYVMDVDVDPGLVEAYNSANAGGRNKLPEVTTGQVVATSKGKVRIGVRDVGKLLDLRHIYPWDPGFISSLNIQKTCTQSSAPAGPIGITDPGYVAPPPPLDSSKLALTKPCKNDSDCLSNKCHDIAPIDPPNFVCIQGTLSVNSPCTHESQCASKSCPEPASGNDKVCANGGAAADAVSYSVSGTLNVQNPRDMVTEGDFGEKLLVVLRNTDTNMDVTYWGSSYGAKSSQTFNYIFPKKIPPGSYRLFPFMKFFHKEGPPTGEIPGTDIPITIVNQDLADKNVTITLPVANAPPATTHTVSGKIVVSGVPSEPIAKYGAFLHIIDPIDRTSIAPKSTYGAFASKELTYSIEEVPPGRYLFLAQAISTNNVAIFESQSFEISIGTDDLRKDIPINFPATVVDEGDKEFVLKIINRYLLIGFDVTDIKVYSNHSSVPLASGVPFKLHPGYFITRKVNIPKKYETNGNTVTFFITLTSDFDGATYTVSPEMEFPKASSEFVVSIDTDTTRK